MNGTEFYANATLGFRQWCFSLGADGAPLLGGLIKHGFHLPRYCWDLEGPNHAECPRLKLQPSASYDTHGEVPATGCSCGFYAHGRRHGSGSETAVHVVGGVVAGWGNLELHERGFKCSVARILALFEPDTRRSYADYGGVADKKWAALVKLCADNTIPLLEPDALKDDEDVRHYASERDLALLENQLSHEQPP